MELGNLAHLLPVRPRSASSSVRTLSDGDVPVLTPCQSVVGVAALQSKLALPARASFAVSRTEQSRTSRGFRAGRGTTTPFAHAARVSATRTLALSVPPAPSLASTLRS